MSVTLCKCYTIYLEEADVKNADIICYMLTSLVYLKLANIKKSKVLIKIVNIDEKNLYIFLTT